MEKIMRLEVRLWCGVLASALFTLVWLIEGALRPGYDPYRNWISELALTDRGWIQIASFLLSGTLVLVFARGLRAAMPTGPGSVWGPRLIAATGVALVAAGLFVIDPGLGYPPGAEAVQTWHGALHDLAGSVMFLSLVAATIVYSRRFARPYALASGIAVLLGWLAAGVLAGLDYAGVWSPAPAGVAQRLSVLVGFGWLAYLAGASIRDARAESGPRG
jgi:hypothetical membrane protein